MTGPVPTPSAGPTRDDTRRAAPRPDVDPAEDLEDALGRAMRGDATGFVTLYRELQPRLFRYARALVGQDADDVTGEAWLQIARDLPSFFGDLDGFRGWATSIVRHRALDLVKARTRRRAEPLGLHGIPELADLTAAGDTAEAAIAALSTAQAVEIIGSLPQDQAEAVLLRAVVGLSAEAAGAVLGKRAGAVRVAAHRGLKTLARRIGRASGDAEEQS
ncbi:RNA polymerase sigma factor [Actinomycetospora chlora]|uniref:RNA polymerase sigma factor n=1 Tax=Actinomycetospora chlora TaxID=663608 RepID=A0ABP9B3R2_9PSEU